MKNPAVANVVTFSGFDILSRSAQKTNSGISFVTLKDWSERKDPAQDARNLAPALRARSTPTSATASYRLQPAADPGHQRHRRLRALPAGSLGRHARQPRPRRPTRSAAGRQPAARAARRVDDLHHRRAAISHRRRSREGARRSASRSTPSSRPCRARSAACTSTTSRCSGAPTASACRRKAEFRELAGRPAPRLRALRRTARWCR